MGAVKELLLEMVPFAVVLGVTFALVAPLVRVAMWLTQSVVPLVTGLGAWLTLSTLLGMWVFDFAGSGPSKWEQAKARAEKKAAQRGDVTVVD